MPFCVPEPEPNKSEAEQDASHMNQVGLIVPSSDEENEEEDQPHLNGYEPLPVIEDNESSDEEEVEQPVVENSTPQKTFEIDQDLVRHMMKNVKLDLTSIPPWAKEISDSAWKEVVHQAVGKETAAANNNTNIPTCSQTESHSSEPS